VVSDAVTVIRRVGIVGDVHAEDGLLTAALTSLAGRGDLDALWSVGDIVTGFGDAGRCVGLLQEFDVATVRGNHDRWLVTNPTRYAELPRATPHDGLTPEQREWLAILPAIRQFESPRGPVLLCHGTGRDDMLGVYPHDGRMMLLANLALQDLIRAGFYRMMVCGHTHARMVRDASGLTIINAGTLRRDQSPGFVVVDFEEGWVQGYDLDPESGAVCEGGRAEL
jgi:predicted phosphodiesterase